MFLNNLKNMYYVFFIWGTKSKIFCMWNRNHFRNYGNHSSTIMLSIVLETFLSFFGYLRFYYGWETIDDFMFHGKNTDFRYLTWDNCVSHWECIAHVLKLCIFKPQESVEYTLSWELSFSIYKISLWIFNICYIWLYCILYLLLTLVLSLMF